jgi:hypothetical protein
MKSSTFLRIAAVITLLYFAGHTASIPWTPDAGPGATPLLEAMKAHSFDVVGVKRTYWDFYFGFGVIISGYLFVQAVVLWQLGSLAKREPSKVRAIIVSFFVAFIVNAFLSWKYFFPIPLIMASLISVCLGLALFFSGRSSGAQTIVESEQPERELQG